MPATTATTTYSANDLTYGVEIECGIDHRLCPNLRIGGHGCGFPVAELPAPGGRNWRADHDGSVHVENRTAVEFVSPVLKGGEGFDNIKATVDQIKAWGGRVNQSCGLHVHVHFPTDSIEALRRLYRLVSRVEEGIYCSTGTPSRANGGWCRSIKKAKGIRWNGLSVANSTEKRNLMFDNQTDLFSNRYHLLNVTNYLQGRQPTVEFRAFSGTLNADKINAWVRICVSLVEMALNGINPAWEVSERTLLHVPEGGQPETRGQSAVNYLIFYLWRQAHGGRKFGKIDHDRYTTRRAMNTLRELATRHDQRAGLNPITVPNLSSTSDE